MARRLITGDTYKYPSQATGTYQDRYVARATGRGRGDGLVYGGSCRMRAVVAWSAAWCGRE
jgi:hypothetical protein